MRYQPEASDAGTLTSTTLLGRVAGRGDDAAEREFLARYEPMVRAVTRACGLTHADAEDVTQEVMLATVQALRQHRYDRERGRFRLFFKGIIAHKVRDALAGLRRDRHLQRDVEATAERTNPEPLRGPLASVDARPSLATRRGEAARAQARGSEEPLPHGRGEPPDAEPLPDGRGSVIPANPLPHGRGSVIHAAPLPDGRGEPPDAEPLPDGRGSEIPRPRRARVSEWEPVDPSPSPAEAFEAAFDAEWQKVVTEEALDVIRHEVEPVTFQAFDLYVRKDMKPGEVAKLLGISRNVVYIAKTRILGRLKELLDEDA